MTATTHRDRRGAPGQTVPELLRSAAELVAPAMRDAVARLDQANRRMAGYHLGWTDLAGRPHTGDGKGGGKGVRPALALLSARAAGAPERLGVPGAVAVELVHNFSLLHDDVMDGDTERRHRPTVWAVWGVGNAILAGDTLLALAVEVLVDSPGATTAKAVRLVTETTRELVRGQTMDLSFERRDDVGVGECLDMAGGKTGALLSASAAIGAVLAGAPEPVVHALARYGHQLGLAFQLVDDLLGIWGDPKRTGKPVYSDLRSRKKSLPVAYALGKGGDAGKELAEWLAADPAQPQQPDTAQQPDTTQRLDAAQQPDAAQQLDTAEQPDAAQRLDAAEQAPARRGHAEPGDTAELRRVAELVEAAGGRSWARREASRRLSEAVRVLAEVPIDAAARAELSAIAHFVVTRES